MRKSPVLLNNSIPQNQTINLKNSATYVNISTHGKTIKTLVDSGAESTLMSWSLAKSLKLKILENDNNIVYIAANGQPLKTMGWTLLHFSMGKFEMTQKCVVIDKLSTNLLLGTDTLCNYGMVINYGNHTLSVGKITVNLYTNLKQTSTCINVCNSITIKPNGTHVEWYKVPENFKESLLVESIGMNHVFIKNGLFDAKDGRIPLIITNKRNFPVELSKGKYLGKVEIVNVAVENSIQTVISELEKNKINSKKISEIVNLNSELTECQSKKLKELLMKYEHIFSKDKNDLGFYDKTKFKIDTGNERPIKSRPYRVPYAQQENVDKLIEEMFQNKIISKSSSPWASPIVIVKKKDGTDRFCVDYRKLNNITIKDNYPVPLIQETLDSLIGASWFSTLDLSSGYWQMALDKETKGKTAFISKKGLFEFEVLPFGLSNAVAAFQRMMEEVLDGVKNSMPYIDDIMTHSKTFDEHLVDLEIVFKKLDEANLKLKPSKCFFANRETKFLGFDINSKGIRPSQEKFEAMKNYPEPKNAKSVKRFLGMASYYRRFIPNYSRITEPINRLLKKNEKFVWSDDCEISFRKIKHLLINPPILVYPDFTKQFILTTDASGIGLGAVLSQIGKDGLEHPIGYASRLLNNAERNYAATELECLGIVWGIEQFRPYLYGRHFIINCDHNPLVYLENTKNKSSRVTRWRLQLAEYDKEIRYKKGILNTNADALSRIGEKIETEVKNESKSKICKENNGKDIDKKVINIVNTNNFDEILPNDIIREQNEDEYTKALMTKVRNGEHSKYLIKNDILYKERKSFNKEARICLVVPLKLRQTVFRMCHDDMGGGHLGMKKTWPKIRDRFYWDTMYKDTVNWLKACIPCAKRKTPKVTKIGLNPINEADQPFDMVGMDVLGPLTETPRGNKYIVVFSDYGSRWPEGFAMKDKKTTTISKIYVNEVVSRHGAPKILLSDQGGEFMSKLVKDICSYLKTTKVNTTAYHPQTNGLTERFNATLCQMLAIYVDLNQQNWDELLPIVLFAYRTAIQETTLQSPFEILYNRTPRLPNDLESVRIENKVVKDFNTNWLAAKKRIREVGEKSKRRFDSKYKEKVIEIGDSVRLLSLPTKTGLKLKLRGDLWTGPFKVIGKLPNGNLKLNIYKKYDQGRKNPYITHPDRVKLAEIEYFEEMKKEKSRNNKRVTFNNVDEITGHDNNGF